VYVLNIPQNMGVAEAGWVEIWFLSLSTAESKGRQNEYLNEKLDFLCSVKKIQ
jgi:hypothetical protein